ncbi:MAG: type II toxin-antitoxin system PemK/MazF family toxin [Lachnospiraceae bacterium]|nr:type II toxin-antitoxin system PemK/MazF family toxin [Lachnospiraceae bacterium]
MAEMNRWEIWEADVPFQEGNGSKLRPVLILSDQEVFALSLKMTSHEPRYKKMEGEYEIYRWQEAGLEKPTVIQCSKKLKLDKSRFTSKQYGRLTTVDIIGLQAVLKYMGIEE